MLWKADVVMYNNVVVPNFTHNPMMFILTLITARGLIARKVLGIKIHPEYHGYNVLDYADELFSFANAHKAAIHPGGGF